MSLVNNGAFAKSLLNALDLPTTLAGVVRIEITPDDVVRFTVEYAMSEVQGNKILTLLRGGEASESR